MAAQTMPRLEAEVLCELEKSADPSSDWKWVAPGAWAMGFGVVCVPPRRGMVVELYCSPGQRVKQPKMNLGLWDRTDGEMRRVYQLTVALAHVATHTDENGEVWYGSHEHVGADVVRANQLDGRPFPEALAHFLARTTLNLEGPIHDPFYTRLT